jgi:hypothetical protein
MYLDFDLWPSKELQFLLGKHAGSVYITSEKGIIHLYAQLLKDNRGSITGSCDLRTLDTKKNKKNLYIVNWAVDKKVAIKVNAY